MITLDIPVTPHVKKFMTVLYGESYILNMNDTLGKAIHVLLNKRINSNGLLKNTEDPTYPVKISYSKRKNEGFVIHKTNIYMISQFCDKYFREVIFLYTLIRSINSKDHNNIKKGIREALYVFDVSEEDISLDTLYRDYMRKRMKPPYSNLYLSKFPDKKTAL